MNQRLLEIDNHHTEHCGEPPLVRSTPGRYIGYFENAHGEQFVFECDLESGAATLRGGDLDWKNVYPVERGEEGIFVPGIVLSAAEMKWLAACHEALKIQRYPKERP